MNTKPSACPPGDAIRHALNRLVCAYVDLKIPVPEELAFMEPDDKRGSVRPAAKGGPAPGSRRFIIPTCFSPLYSADTPTTSMRKLGPVAWHAVAQGFAEIEVPELIDPDKLRRLHAPEYVDDFLAGRQPLASSQGWPWTPEIRDGVLAINAGQLLGAELAMKHGIAANTGQGAHHAEYARGGAFCTFNSLALVASEHPEWKCLVIDVDTHEGNGVGEFAARLDNLWNFTIFGSNFGGRGHSRHVKRRVKGPVASFAPYRKALNEAFAFAEKVKPDLIQYNAGVDCYVEDGLDSVGLTAEMLFERDRLVFEFCKQTGSACLYSLAGGYLRDMDKLVSLHVGTFKAACAAWD